MLYDSYPKLRLLRLVYRIFLWIVILFLLCLILTYIALTNSYSLKNYLIPFASKKVGIPISVENISFSLLWNLKVKELKVGTNSIFIENGSVDFNLIEIIKSKKIVIDKLVLEKGALNILHHKDGSFSIDFLKKNNPEEKGVNFNLNLNLQNLKTDYNFEDYVGEGFVTVNNIKGGEVFGVNSDLVGSQIRLKVDYSPSRILLNNLNLDLKDKSDNFIKSEILGELNLPLGKKLSSFNISSEKIDIDQIIKLFSVKDKNQPTSTQIINSEISEPKNKTCKGIDLSDLFLNLNLKIKELNYQNNVTQDIVGKIAGEKGKIEISKFTWNQNNIPASFSGEVNFQDPECSFRYKLELDKTPFSNFLNAIGQNKSGLENGTLEKAVTSGVGKGFSIEKIKDSFNGELEVKLTEVNLPSNFKDIPPFNLIFLPFKIVMDIGGSVSSFVLPESLMKLGSDARGIFDGSGQLYLNKAEVKLKAKDKKVFVEKSIFNTNLFPTIDFSGDVGFDEKLDLVTTIHLLGIQVRIPIAGSLSLPLPNIIELVPQIVKGLGLSIIDPIKGIFEEKEEKVGVVESQQK